MATWIARDCGCEQEVYNGQKREKLCELHGNLFESEAAIENPNRVIPLCGPFPAGCHGDAEYRRINVLSHLTLEEQLQAVKDAGGIEAARIRLEPVTHREEVEASSAPAIEGAVG
jgi:hypothetical protein